MDIFGQFFRIDNVFEARSACANSVFSTPKVRCTAFASPNRSGRIARHEHDLPSAAPSHVGFWHLADNPTAPAFVRFWTKADLSPCPLMTRSGHKSRSGKHHKILSSNHKEQRKYGVANSGSPVKSRVILFSSSIFRLNWATPNARSVEHFAIKCVTSPSSLRDVMLQATIFPLIRFPSIINPPP